MRPYAVWRCQRCRHLIARDRLAPANPGRCRGLCGGEYEAAALEDPEMAPWGEGEESAREIAALRRCYSVELQEVR